MTFKQELARSSLAQLLVKWLPIIAGIVIVFWYVGIYNGNFKSLWVTADQQAYQLYKKQQFLPAAQAFENPAFKASAYYHAGEFKKAAAVFATMNDATARYNLGNTYLMMGKYPEAIESYDLALKIRAGFNQAEENKAIAIARQAKLDQGKDNDEGTSGQLDADEIVYDNKNKRGDDSIVQDQLDQGNVSHWLDRLQTSPQQFLKHKFAYQYQQQQTKIK